MWGGVEKTIIDQRMNANTCPHRKLSTSKRKRPTEISQPFGCSFHRWIFVRFLCASFRNKYLHNLLVTSDLIMEASFLNGLNLFINQTIFQHVLYFLALRTRTFRKHLLNRTKESIWIMKNWAQGEICAMHWKCISITGELISVEKKTLIRLQIGRNAWIVFSTEAHRFSIGELLSLISKTQTYPYQVSCAKIARYKFINLN